MRLTFNKSLKALNLSRMNEETVRAGVKLTDDFWNLKVRITCEEKLGECRHNMGDTFVYSNPMHVIPDMCSGIGSPAGPYVPLCAVGVPSWESDDKDIYRIHCISKKGTVWRLERIDEETET